MNGIITKIEEGMKQFGYKAKTVSITHLPGVQEAVGKLVRQGLLNKRLHETWHFYLKTNENLPEVKTIVVVAIPQPLTRVWFKCFIDARAYTNQLPFSPELNIV